MSNTRSTSNSELIIIGGGFAGIELAKQLRNKPIKITLLDKNNYHTFQPLLYQVASGGLGPDAIAYPLRKIVSKIPNSVYRLAEVLEIDSERNKVITDVGEFHYDYLCIATGSQTNFFGNKELEENCMQLKSIPDALDLRSDILQEFEKALNQPADIEKLLRFVVVGGGPTGVETSGALAEFKKNVIPNQFKEIDPEKMEVHLVESSPRLLAAFNEKSSAGALKFLNELGVAVHLNTAVKTFNRHSGELVLSTGETMKTNTVIWSAGVMGKTIKGIAEKSIGRSNRYFVDRFNLIKGYTNIYAIGDIALMNDEPKYPNGHPMVAPVAIQQAKLFSENIIRSMNQIPLKEFTYFDKGSMATIGRHKAVFESFGIKMQGYFAWLGWMFLHLMLLVGYRNRIIVFINWMWNYFSYQRAIQIITRPFVPKRSEK